MPRDKITHTNLIQHMQKLGYKSNEWGICFGVAHMAMQAILAKEYTTFNERLTTINEKPDNPSTDIKAFFDGIELYHNSRYYTELNKTLTTTDSQNADLALSLVQPTKLESEGGIECIDRFSGVYSNEELTAHFKIFRTALQNQPTLKSPTAFILKSTNHAITVGFDPIQNKWLLADAEDLPIKELSYDNAIALAVKYALNGMISKASIFSTTIYATKNQKKALDQAFCEIESNQTWERIHTVTPEKAQLTDHGNTSWLLIANQFEIINQLLLEKANPNQQAENGLTPLRAALQNRDIAITKTLLEFGANPNIATKKGITPLMSAAYNNLIDFFILFLENGGDLDQKDEKGLSTRTIAIMPGHEKIATAIKQYEERKPAKTAALFSPKKTKTPNEQADENKATPIKP